MIARDWEYPSPQKEPRERCSLLGEATGAMTQPFSSSLLTQKITFLQQATKHVQIVGEGPSRILNGSS